MVRRFWPIVLLIAVGCFPEETHTQLVPTNPFPNSPIIQPPKQISGSPASEEAAKRVGLVGQKILLANPQLSVRPLFRTIGAPHQELFHQGPDQLFITEGLVKRCSTEGQLAAVLCVELGRMAAEHEALIGPQATTPERAPPVELRVGNDGGGAYGPPDLTRLAELGKYEQERRRPSGTAPPPDSQALARTCLMRAGYSAVDLDTVAPLLKTSAGNSQLEKQLLAPAGQRSWTQ